jgi:hypothetical protein
MSNYIYMVETPKPPFSVWTGDTVHLTDVEAESARSKAGRITPFLVSDPAKAVRDISKRLAARQSFSNECPCPVCDQQRATTITQCPDGYPSCRIAESTGVWCVDTCAASA